jgi:hypothetical protein
MAEDLKYGKVTLERGTIGENEPVVIFRARDKLLPKVLAYYHLFCLKEGSPKKHLDLIMQRHEEIKDWQNKNETKVPASDGYGT